jgi:hypothetical protein
MTNIVGLVVLGIAMVGMIFAVSTVIFIANLSFQAMQAVNGNANASENMGQSIADETQFEVSSGLILGIVIAILVAIGAPTAIILALRKL